MQVIIGKNHKINKKMQMFTLSDALDATHFKLHILPQVAFTVQKERRQWNLVEVLLTSH